LNFNDAFMIKPKLQDEVKEGRSTFFRNALRTRDGEVARFRARFFRFCDLVADDTFFDQIFFDRNIRTVYNRPKRFA
jgi:hypothetical protein